MPFHQQDASISVGAAIRGAAVLLLLLLLLLPPPVGATNYASCPAALSGFVSRSTKLNIFIVSKAGAARVPAPFHTTENTPRLGTLKVSTQSQLSVSQILIVLSMDPEASSVPFHATDLTSQLCPFKVLTQSQLPVSQILDVFLRRSQGCELGLRLASRLF